MPLLKKKPFPLDEPPEDLEPKELVFQVRFTKEIYRDYHDYLNRINFYRQRVWMCKVTAKTNLTYEEALVSEKLATEKVLQFPKDLVAPALRIIQYSMLSLKDLADAIMAEILQNQLFVGTELYAMKDGEVAPCKILEVIRGINKVHYEIGWLDEKKKIIAKSEVSRAALIQKKLRLSRNILKSFIRQSTYRNAPWVINNELAQNHGISTDIPEELRGTIFFKNGLICKKKRKYEEFKDEDGNHFRKKSEKGGRKGLSIGEENCNSEEEPIKYPIDDLLVKPGPYDSVLGERPSPCRDFSVPMDCVGDLLMVWDFCSSFCKLLYLWPFSLEDFENAIGHKDGNVVLLVECHAAILRLLIEDNGQYFICVQKRRQKSKITLINWTDYLCDFLEMIKLPELCHYESTIKRGHYSLVDTQGKLGILRELVNHALETATVREKLDEFIQQRQELGASKRGEALEDGKKRRQEKEQLKADSESNNNCKQMVGTTNENGEIDTAREGSLAEESGRNNSNPMPKRKQKRRMDVKLLSENGKESSGKESQHDAESDQGTVGKSNVEERREYYEREMEKRFIRTNPLGKDKHYNRYWWFRRDGRIFVESSDTKEWGYYISMEELDQLMASLNCKDVRERELWRQLKRYYNRMSLELQKRSKDLTHQIALDEGVLRRSTRVRAPPRENPTNAFLRYVNKWKED